MTFHPELYFAEENLAERKINEDPELLKITRFRRYGIGSCFEFFAHLLAKGENKPKTYWLKYKDLEPNPAYVQYLRIHGFNIDTECHNYLDDEDGNSGDESLLPFYLPKSQEKKKVPDEFKRAGVSGGKKPGRNQKTAIFHFPPTIKKRLPATKRMRDSDEKEADGYSD